MGLRPILRTNETTQKRRYLAREGWLPNHREPSSDQFGQPITGITYIGASAEPALHVSCDQVYVTNSLSKLTFQFVREAGSKLSELSERRLELFDDLSGEDAGRRQVA